MIQFLKVIWAFCSYLFWPQWGSKHKVLILCLLPLCCWAQEYNGTTGLMALPTAEMADAGTFRGGAFFLSKHFTPDKLVCEGEKYNTGGYYISLAPWKWVEVSYSAVLLKFHKNRDVNEPVGYYNEDRNVSMKLNPLYEGKWWPAIAIGVDNAQQFVEKLFKAKRGSSNMQNAYIMASKHFDIRGNELSAHLGYRYFVHEANSNRTGVVGGIAFRPALYPPLRLMAEWDGVGINAGADVLLWRHLFIQAALIHGRGFTGGIGYHYTIPF